MVDEPNIDIMVYEWREYGNEKEGGQAHQWHEVRARRFIE